ncbi:MAG: Ig-like domain-containing protein [Tannerella sp.]|jgi:hypothetical protein|nr:Ig-like domain-containing protein [Tannerella sp.]
MNGKFLTGNKKMKKNMKSTLSRLVALSCSALLAMSCSKYERTEVTPSIYVDQMTLKMFTGETVRLQASPNESTCIWTCEDSEVATVSPSGDVTALAPGATNIVVTDGNVYTKIPLTVVTRIAMTGMSLSIDYVELTPGMKTSLGAVKIPENANDGGIFLWTTGNIDVATVSSAGEITGVSEGEAIITCRNGLFSETVKVSVAYTRPFKGPHILSSEAPYTLPAVNFDIGGEGYAFHDADAINNGNLPYRSNNGDNTGGSVDMENAANPNVGWTGDGEWLLYTVEVRTGGKYKVEIEHGSPYSDGSFRLEVDGVDRTGVITVSNTGGHGNYGWDVVPAPLNLSEGTHKIKYCFVHGVHNVRTLRFTYAP